MANLINVDPYQMKEKAKIVGNHIDDWRETVQSIYTLVRELDDMWDGLANSEFNLNFEQDRPLYDRLENMMREYEQELIQLAQGYEDGEREVIEIIRRR